MDFYLWFFLSLFFMGWEMLGVILSFENALVSENKNYKFTFSNFDSRLLKRSNQ